MSIFLEIMCLKKLFYFILFLWRKFAVLLYIYINIYKRPKQYGQGNLLENFPKKLSHLKENRFEIVKILGGFGGGFVAFFFF
jgi:hypothetical protein